MLIKAISKIYRPLRTASPYSALREVLIIYRFRVLAAAPTILHRRHLPPPQPQSLSLENAIYFQQDQKQWIRAGSDATPQGSAVIEATLVYGNTEVPLGQIGWKPDLGHYQQVFKDISQTPDSVILTDNEGESVTGTITIK